MRWSFAAFVVAALLGAASLGCGEGSLRSAGEECSASSQCGPGLVCDMGMDPSVCAMMGTPPPPPEPDAPPEEIIDADPNAPDAAPQPDADETPDADEPPDADETPDA